MSAIEESKPIYRMSEKELMEYARRYIDLQPKRNLYIKLPNPVKEYDYRYLSNYESV